MLEEHKLLGVLGVFALLAYAGFLLYLLVGPVAWARAMAQLHGRASEPSPADTEVGQEVREQLLVRTDDAQQQ